MTEERPFTVVAIIAAHNEADVIEHVVRDLIEQGVSVYFIDDDSTDGTREIVERYVGRGVLAVERFDGEPGVFELARILRRKVAICRTLEADWIINHDADEFRESPWPDTPLADAIRLVDRLGYNAIDFALLDFWPVDDSFEPGTDVRLSIRQFANPQSLNRIQIRCWKNQPEAVELVAQGGHEPAFVGRDIFPVPFLLRHYPIRSVAHGRRKVFAERRPRFSPAEVAGGWHRQYDDVQGDDAFRRSPADLATYDPIAVRRALFTGRFFAATGEDSVELLNQQTLELANLRNQVLLSQRTAAALRESLDAATQKSSSSLTP